jgi:carbon storage regulator CsrA
MLILERHEGQAVMLSGGIVVHVKRIRGDRVRLGFDAPAGVRIAREEIAEGFGGVGIEHGTPETAAKIK